MHDTGRHILKTGPGNEITGNIPFGISVSRAGWRTDTEVTVQSEARIRIRTVVCHIIKGGFPIGHHTGMGNSEVGMERVPGCV